MKTMTKLLSVLLLLAMLFTFAACNTTPETPDDGDNSGDNSGDNGENNNGENPNKALYAEMADKFVTGALTQLETAKSIKFTVNMDLEATEDYEGDTYDFLEKRSGKAEFTVSEINGKLALSAHILTKEAVDEYMELHEGHENAQWRYYIEEAILKDGKRYHRDYYYFDTYTDAEIEAMKAVSLWRLDDDDSGLTNVSFSEMITMIKEETAEYKTKLDELKASAKEFIAGELEKGGISDGKLEWSYDAASNLNEIMSYLKGLTPNDNIAKIINDALAALEIELTVDTLIEKVIEYGDTTVAKVIADLEGILAENGLGTLQEIWDSVITSDAFAMLAEELEMPEEVKAQLAAVKIFDIVEQYGQYTVADVIYTMFAAQNSEPEYGGDTDMGVGEFEESNGDEFDGEYEEIQPEGPIMTAPEGFLEGMLAEITPMLYATFGEMEMDVFELIYEIFDIELDKNAAAQKLAAKLGVEFDTENGSMKGITFGIDIDASATAKTSEYDEEADESIDVLGVSNTKMKLDVTVEEISGTAAAINEPAPEMILKQVK